ncbi:MAG: cell division protein SepF [Clostridia bacterium]|nr:cell division protein SepF [Clostridia bacterium]
MGTMNKMLKWIGISDEEEEVYEVEAEGEEVIEPATPLGRKAKVSSIAGSGPSKVVVIQFLNFDDAKDAADHLKNRKPIVANLEKLDNETTRRVVDFLSGAVYGVGGKIQNVSNRIFLITPSNVEVTGNYRDGAKASGFPFVN